MEFNPSLVKKFISGQTLRRTKTNKKEAMLITKYLISAEYKPHPKQFCHNYSLKSLSRMRERFVKQRSYYEVQLTNVLDLTFPEFKPFFDNSFSATALFILNKYKTADKIKNIKDFEAIKSKSRGRFSYSKFLKLKELARDTISCYNDVFILELESLLTLHSNINNQIKILEDKI